MDVEACVYVQCWSNQYRKLKTRNTIVGKYFACRADLTQFQTDHFISQIRALYGIISNPLVALNWKAQHFTPTPKNSTEAQQSSKPHRRCRRTKLEEALHIRTRPRRTCQSDGIPYNLQVVLLFFLIVAFEGTRLYWNEFQKLCIRKSASLSTGTCMMIKHAVYHVNSSD